MIVIILKAQFQEVRMQVRLTLWDRPGLGGESRRQSAEVVLPIYSLGGDFRFSAFTNRLLAVDFSSSVLFVSIISPSSVEITCCCFRGFFLGEAPGGRSLVGMDRLLASRARDGDTVLVARGGTAVGVEHTSISTKPWRASLNFQSNNCEDSWLANKYRGFSWAWPYVEYSGGRSCELLPTPL